MSTVQMGFRGTLETHEKVTELANKQGRSIANVLNIMVAEQLKRVESGGFDALFHKEEGNYEQERAG